MIKKFSVLIALLCVGLLYSSANAQTCPLATQKPYKSPDNTSVFYITDTCTKRPFKSSNSYFTYFSSWNDVTETSIIDTIADDELTFMPAGPLYDPQYGALVKTVTDPKVYLLLGTEKYWITDPDVFEALGYQWNWIEDVDPRLLESYTNGDEINYTDHHPNYTLIKYPNSNKVYRLEPKPSNPNVQIRRHIVDQETFNELGFRFDRIVTIPVTEYYKDGEPLGTVQETTVSSKLYEIEGLSNTITYSGAVSLDIKQQYARAKWQTTQGNFSGIGMPIENNYFIAYGKPNSVGIALYSITDNELIGESTINYLNGDIYTEKTTRLTGSIDDYVGTFQVTGLHTYADGSGGTISYTGTLNITKQNEIYSLEWSLGGYELHGIGFIRNNVLGVAWGSPAARDAQVFGLSYLEHTNSGYDSEWITIGHTTFSTESWKLRSNATNLDDIYAQPLVAPNTKTIHPIIDYGNFYAGAFVEVDYRDTDNAWYEAQVIAVDGDNIHVRYKSFDTYQGDEEVIKREYVRFVPAGYTSPPHTGDWIEFYDGYGRWFAGKITNVNGDQCYINDAGFSESNSYFHAWYDCAITRPYPFTEDELQTWYPGQVVEAKWEYSWYRAIIVENKGNNTYTVISDDGYDWEWEVPSFLIRTP